MITHLNETAAPLETAFNLRNPSNSVNIFIQVGFDKDFAEEALFFPNIYLMSLVLDKNQIKIQIIPAKISLTCSHLSETNSNKKQGINKENRIHRK